MAESRVNAHGGDIYKAAELYGFRRQELLDYSANINPFGVPQELADLIVSNISQLVNYPDPDCKDLCMKLSQYFDVQERNIVIGNGASEIIFLLFEALKPGRVLIPAPSFSEYAKAAQRYDAEICYFQLKEKDNFKLDIDALISGFSEDIDAVILCNPNNPTSALVKKPELVRLLEAARQKGISVILDEAFIELTEEGNGNSMVNYITQFENLFIIRAFTKCFAIPGLRLGYGIGNEELVKKMWENKLPWSVNTFACCAGELLNMAGDYMKKTRQWISEERLRFYQKLTSFEKLKVFEPETNFVLVKILDDSINSAGLKEAMAAKGILIRDASNFKFLDGSFFRLAIKDKDSNDRVISALREILNC